jgi:uncharacterized Rossmann fold enzyme
MTMDADAGQRMVLKGLDPHSAERLILIGPDVASAALVKPSAMRLVLHPDRRHHWLMDVTRWLTDTVKYSSTTCTIMVSPACQNWPEAQAIVALTQEHYKQARINQNTVEAIGERQGRNFVMNLRGIVHAPGQMRDARKHLLPDLYGQTVIICGAGPSFDQSAHWVALHRGPVIAVNTSAGACAQRGIKPVAIVCTETKSVREGIERMPEGSRLAMDLIGNPNNWQRGVQLCFMGTEPNLASYAQRLDMLPLAYGSSCTTAAVSLALACGAARVVLVGQDCCFQEYAYRKETQGQSAWPQGTGDDDVCVAARMYASGTPYEETTVIINASKQRAAIRKPTVGTFETDVIQVDGNDGMPVWTTHSMMSFAHWFRDQPDDVRARVVNCTAHGAWLEGIEFRQLEDVIVRDKTKALAAMGADLVTRGQHSANELAMVAADVLKHLVNVAKHGLTIRNDATLLEWVRKHPIYGMWTGPARLRMRRLDSMTSNERGNEMASVIRRACTEIIQCAQGEYRE